MSILVVGAGIGGLAVARACALRGASVRVLERAEAIREVGAGLQISPNGLAVLTALGLDRAVAKASVLAKSVSLRDYRHGEVMRLDLSDKRRSFHVVHRADLIQVLADGARDAGVKIDLGCDVAHVTPGEIPRLTLTDGRTMQADLIIGADGLRSRLRPAITPTKDAFFTGQVAFRALVDNNLGLGDDVRLYMAPRRHVVLYPLKGGAKLNVVAIQERSDWAEESWTKEADADELRARFADFGADIRDVMASIDQVHMWGLFRHEVALTWQSGSVALLGDAAHPMLPFLAQGANMALEDAWVLADALEGEGALTDRLTRYQTRRRARVCRVVEAANGNAWKYHLAFKPLRFAAHSYLRLAGRFAPDFVLKQFDWLYQHDVTQDG